MYLLWECPETRKVWQSFNEYMSRISNSQIKVGKFEDVFDIYPNRTLSVVKVKVIQAMIQIERPRSWNWERVRRLAMDLKNVEIYNSVALILKRVFGPGRPCLTGLGVGLVLLQYVICDKSC